MTERKRATHHIDPDGAVIVSLRDLDGRVTSSVKLSVLQAKVLAWGILADVDPDELDAVYQTPEDQGHKTQQDILGTLARGPARADDIAKAVDLGANEALGRLMKLRRQGLVAKLSGDKGPKTFSITADGIAAWKSFGSPVDGRGGRTAA